MRVRVLFFGMLKDIVGKSADLIDLPDGASVRSGEDVPICCQAAGELLPVKGIEVDGTETVRGHGIKGSRARRSRCRRR